MKKDRCEGCRYKEDDAHYRATVFDAMSKAQLDAMILYIRGV